MSRDRTDARAWFRLLCAANVGVVAGVVFGVPGEVGAGARLLALGVGLAVLALGMALVRVILVPREAPGER